ncbi:MAG: amino acid decarboxylase [Candidatus Nanopelagicales bacterium]|nr:amino acid decarboxylase [Candidatus Nanopelagicales bacterium]
MSTADEHQAHAPYAEALHQNARQGWTRLGVPGHQDQPANYQSLESLAGPALLAMDIPMFTEGVDLPAAGASGASPLQEALDLAADAWGAKRTWFLTNGASQGNHAACLALRALSGHAVVQRSVHTSVIDGAILAGLRLEFVHPNVDVNLGIAHGATPSALDEVLNRCPGAAAAYVVTPSYFGAVSDVRALAEVAHQHGVPLVVDEAWGSHFGFHPDLPESALACGADLVISSTHKLAGSLSQSAMLHLGQGSFADLLEPLVTRALMTLQTTSPSAILLSSLDLARRDLYHLGQGRIGASIGDANLVRTLLAQEGRFKDSGPAMLAAPDVIALDPLHIVVDTSSGGVPGFEARRLLEASSRIHVEMATDSVIVAIVGAGSRLDANFIVEALHAMPVADSSSDWSTNRQPIILPPTGPRARDVREAYFATAEVVPAAQAIGRISGDTLAAYPPGVANVLPGEVVTAAVVEFLQATAQAPYGWVRGAVDAGVGHLRVLVEK